MSKAPAFQFYPGDRLQELMPIMHDNEAMGAWIKAVMYLWANGPCEEERLGLAVGLGWVRVGFLFSEKNGLLQLDWMEEMRAEKAAFRDKQRANGKKGGRPKAAPIKAENPGLPFGLTQTKAKKSPRVEDEVEDRRLKTEDEDGRLKIEVEEEKKTRERKIHEPAIWPTFDDFWAAYEKKGNRQQAEAQWARIKQADREAIMDRLPDYIATKPEKVYRPDGQRFLKYRNWEDELIAPPTTAPKHQTNDEYAKSVAEAFARKYGITDPA